jgi:Putative zinc-finger
MNHVEALKTQAVERYLLGELSGSETEEFEQHYFACAECAADVAAGAVLQANARAVFQEDQVEPAVERPAVASGFWRRFLAPFQATPAMAATSLATLALALVCSYQLFLLTPQLRREARDAYAAAALPSFPLAGRTRGDAPSISVPRDARFFSVSFDVDPAALYPEYRCDLKDSSGSIRFTVRVPPPPPGQPISILFPARELKPGKYDLVLTGLRAGGVGENQVGDYTFNLQRGSLP